MKKKQKKKTRKDNERNDHQRELYLEAQLAK